MITVPSQCWNLPFYHQVLLAGIQKNYYLLVVCISTKIKAALVTELPISVLQLAPLLGAFTEHHRPDDELERNRSNCNS